MLWLRCELENRPALLTALQGRFETIFNANGAPPEMLLVAEKHDPTHMTVWLRLADERFRPVFPELEETDNVELPKVATLLCGHNAEFKKIFEYDA